MDLTGIEESYEIILNTKNDIGKEKVPDTEWRKVDQKIVDEDSDFEYTEEEKQAFMASKEKYSYSHSSEWASTPGSKGYDV